MSATSETPARGVQAIDRAQWRWIAVAVAVGVLALHLPACPACPSPPERRHR